MFFLKPKLKEYGFKYTRLDGKANAAKREAAIDQFRNDPTITVFLISLKAGGVGLTLIEANRVYLLDPWWNVAAEEQAIDRVHRLGQKKDVHVIRFVCKVICTKLISMSDFFVEYDRGTYY